MLYHSGHKNKDYSAKEPLLKIVHLNAYFSSQCVIKDISLTTYKNEIIALIGPSGCGKSTFIRCINRLHEEIEGAEIKGKIFLDKQNIYDPNVDPVLIRRKIGMVFQKPNPFPGISIFNNVAIGLKLMGIKKKSVLEEKVEQALTQSALFQEVKDILNRPSTSLSGGQQQRLCIARALAIQPSIILMDEPTSALDPISTMKIEELIRTLSQTLTVIIVTHNMQQASRISNRTAFLLNGELIEYEKTSRIFTNPKDERTENYITGRFG